MPSRENPPSPDQLSALRAKESILKDVVDILERVTTTVQQLIAQGSHLQSFVVLRPLVHGKNLSTADAFERVAGGVFKALLVGGGLSAEYAQFIVRSAAKTKHNLSYPDRIQLFRHPLTTWERVDEYLRFTILPVLRHVLLHHSLPAEKAKLEEVKKNIRHSRLNQAMERHIQSTTRSVRRGLPVIPEVRRSLPQRVREILEEHFRSQLRKGSKLVLDEAKESWVLISGRVTVSQGTFAEVEDLDNPRFRIARRAVRARWLNDD